MTVGSRVTDNRRYGVTQAGWVGSYFSKTWNGADQAPRVKRPPRKWHTVSRYEIVKGKRRLVSRYRFPIYTSPPKRARLAEHAYSVSFVNQRDEAMWYPQNGYYLTASSLCAPATSGYADVALLGANDDIKLVNKLREKLTGSDFNMSVFLGEGHQTLRMIGDTAITLAKAIRALKRRQFAEAAAALGVKSPKGGGMRRKGVDNLSSRWLELQYGWLPLLKDAEAGAQQLAHHLNYPQTMTFRASVRREQNRSWKNYANSVIRLNAEQYIFHRRSLIARISEPLTVPQLLGLKDPELVVWELLPFSFVADWFLPIGDWLAARALVSKLTGTFITTDLKDGGYRDYEFLAGVIPLGRSTTYAQKKSLTRSISTTLKVPLPEYKGLDKALSLGHCLNGIALLAQVAKGYRPAWKPK